MSITRLLNTKMILLLLFMLVASASAQESGAVGTVVGTVYDAKTGQPVRRANVQVQELPDAQTSTDIDGQYALKLPIGTYTLRITAPSYLTSDLEGIVIAENEIIDGSTVLALASDVTSIEVVEKVDAVTSTAETMIAERRLAQAVTDGISSDDIGKTTASDAASALEKVTGVQVSDEGFVFVRGLGERYSATMLNNAVVPTTEPEKRVVPLEMFSSKLIDRIQVTKSYTPDLPGEFAGGLVQMSTVEFPSAKLFEVSMSTSLNSRTSFKDFASYPGGGTDFFGFDDGTRSLPSSIPTDERLFRGSFTQEEFQEFGRAFDTNWEPTPIADMRPEQSYSVTAGNTFGKLGVIGSISFANQPQIFDEMFRMYTNAGGGQQQIWTQYDDWSAGSEATRLGAVLNLAYRFSPSHKVQVRNTLTHDSEKEARVFSGFNGGTDEPMSSERLRWIERSVFATQIEGEHLTNFANSLLMWQFSISQANREEPDLREVLRLRQGDDFVFFNSPNSAMRFFSELDERIYEPSAAWSLPFYKGSVSGSFKLGFRATLRDRDFVGRRFRYQLVRPFGIDLTAPSNQLLAPENITPERFELREITRGTDSYTADLDVYAGFAMVDVAFSQKWRVIAGARIEDADMQTVTVDPFVPGSQPAISSLVNRDVLPAANAVYMLRPRMNLRFAYGRTLSRPDFRELSPFEFTDVVGGWVTVGNPDIRRTTIDNVDVRWEWFPGGDQLVAVGYFYKRFDDPIELIFEPGITSRRTFANADSAINQGIELEFRRNLGTLTRGTLSDFSVNTNFTLVDSNIKIPDEIATTVTNLERPLMGQSRYIFNGTLDWTKPAWRSSARGLVNHVSRRITDVGTFGLQDIYQESNTIVDFVYDFLLREKGAWKLRFAAENLTDNEFLWTQDRDLQRRYLLGRTYKIGLSFSVF